MGYDLSKDKLQKTLALKQKTSNQAYPPRNIQLCMENTYENPNHSSPQL
jgi:hypothetical protein